MPFEWVEDDLPGLLEHVLRVPDQERGTDRLSFPAFDGDLRADMEDRIEDIFMDIGIPDHQVLPGIGADPNLACPFPVRDVVAYAEDLHKPTLLVADRLVDPGDPDMVAVSPDVLVHVDGKALGIEPHVVCHHGEVVLDPGLLRYDRAYHVLPDHVLAGIIEECQRIVVEEGDHTLGIHPDDDALGVLQHLPVPGLALPEGIGDLLFLGIVGDDKGAAPGDVPGVQGLDLEVAGNKAPISPGKAAIRMAKAVCILPDQELAADLFVFIGSPEERTELLSDQGGFPDTRGA